MLYIDPHNSGLWRYGLKSVLQTSSASSPQFRQSSVFAIAEAPSMSRQAAVLTLVGHSSEETSLERVGRMRTWRADHR